MRHGTAWLPVIVSLWMQAPFAFPSHALSGATYPAPFIKSGSVAANHVGL